MTAEPPLDPQTEADAPPRSTASDVKVVAVTALVVIALGCLIAASFVWITSRGNNDAEACPAEQPIGVARIIRDDPDLQLIQQNKTIGPGCSLWLALVDGTIVAVKAEQDALDCTVRVDPTTEEWLCDGRPVALDDLEQYPLEVKTVNGEPGILVARLDATA